jgi:hypothetical protein
MVDCFICRAKHLHRPIKRIPIEYPEKGNNEFVPICKKCSKKYHQVKVEIEKGNPGIKIRYIPIPK